ncbi:MAK10-like protein [Tanacetum coccineum]
MDETCAAKRNRIIGITNRHYFEIDIFNPVLDMQIQEFGDRFSEISTHLLSNMSALSSRASFSMFDASKLITLTTLYPDDFMDSDRYFSFGRHLDELHVTWAHLEKKRTRLRTNTKTLEDLCSQSLETASPAIHDAVTTHQVTASHLS